MRVGAHPSWLESYEDHQVDKLSFLMLIMYNDNRKKGFKWIFRRKLGFIKRQLSRN